MNSDDPMGWRVSFRSEAAVHSSHGLEPGSEDGAEPSKGRSRGPQPGNMQLYACDQTDLRYQKVAIIGQGGMGRVWLGWDRSIERNVAIKEPLTGPDSPAARRLAEEAMLTARLEHTGVVAVHDIFFEDERPHFVMALVRGETLASRIEAGEETNDKRLLRVILEVCEVIGHAHSQGILHRDITPRNVLLGDDGTTRVIDWGLAITREAGAEGPGAAGTPGFLSPEQERGDPVTPASDVWGLGALLHTILRGEPPPREFRTSEKAWEPVDELESIMAKALDPEPGKRYPDANAMAEEMLCWFEGRRVEAYDITPWRLVKRLTRVYRRQFLLAAAVFMMVGTALGVGVWNTKHEAERAQRAKAQAERAEEKERLIAQTARESEAKLWVRDAREALKVGDLTRAREGTAKAIRLAPSPDSAGLKMRLAVTPELEFVESRTIEACPERIILTRSYDRHVCQASPKALESKGAAEWSVDLTDWGSGEQAYSSFFEHRVSNQALYILTNPAHAIAFDLETGELHAHVEEPGRFVAGSSARRLRADRTELIGGPKSPCPTQLIEAYEEKWGAVWICTSGEVWVADPDLRRMYDGDLGIPQFAISITEDELWLARTDGTLWPVGEWHRGVELGEPIRDFDRVGDTEFVIVKGWRGGFRLLDTARSQWIASFPATVAAVQATLDAEILVLHHDRTLERWKLPKKVMQRAVTSQHGIASVAWSRDGSQVAAVTGGGTVELFEPFAGRAFPSVQVVPGILKDVEGLAGGGFILGGVEEGWSRYVDVSEGAVVVRRPQTDEDDMLRGTVKRVGVWSDGRTIVMDIGGRVVDAETAGLQRPRGEDLGFVNDLTMATGGERLLITHESYHLVVDAEGTTREEPVGGSYGAVSNGGRVALVREQLLTFSGPAGRWHEIELPARPTAVAWRPGSAHVVVGHLDGSVTIWEADEGRLVGRMHAHTGRVAGVAASPDGDLLATASWDARVEVASFHGLEAD